MADACSGPPLSSLGRVKRPDGGDSSPSPSRGALSGDVPPPAPASGPPDRAALPEVATVRGDTLAAAPPIQPAVPVETSDGARRTMEEGAPTPSDAPADLVGDPAPAPSSPPAADPDRSSSGDEGCRPGRPIEPTGDDGALQSTGDAPTPDRSQSGVPPPLSSASGGRLTAEITPPAGDDPRRAPADADHLGGPTIGSQRGGPSPREFLPLGGPAEGPSRSGDWSPATHSSFSPATTPAAGAALPPPTGTGGDTTPPPPSLADIPRENLPGTGPWQQGLPALGQDLMAEEAHRNPTGPGSRLDGPGEFPPARPAPLAETPPLGPHGPAELRAPPAAADVEDPPPGASHPAPLVEDPPTCPAGGPDTHATGRTSAGASPFSAGSPRAGGAFPTEAATASPEDGEVGGIEAMRGKPKLAEEDDDAPAPQPAHFLSSSQPRHRPVDTDDYVEKENKTEVTRRESKSAEDDDCAHEEMALDADGSEASDVDDNGSDGSINGEVHRQPPPPLPRCHSEPLPPPTSPWHRSTSPRLSSPSHMRRTRAARPPSAAEWDELIAPRDPADPHDSPAPAPRAVKLAVRAGLPAPLRRRAWTSLAGVDAEVRRSAGVYEAFVEKATRLMEDQREEQNVLRVIEKDLKRTLPRHLFFAGADSKKAPAGDVRECAIVAVAGNSPQGVAPTDTPSGNEELPHEILVALRRVLYAYTIHDNEVGYCQGMNFVAAMFLSFLSEEESFWMLAAVMNDCPYEMRGLFAKDMAGVHEKLYVAKRVVQKFLPKLHKHLVNENVDLSMFVLEWMLTIFTSTFPLDLVWRVWDSFIVEGWKVVYRVMLSLLKRAQRDLLGLGMERIIFYLKDEFPSKVDGPAVFKASLKIPLRQKHVRKYTAEWRDAKFSPVVETPKAGILASSKRLAKTLSQRF